MSVEQLSMFDLEAQAYVCARCGHAGPIAQFCPTHGWFPTALPAAALTTPIHPPTPTQEQHP